MTIQPEHRALVFVAAVALLGAGVRVVRAASHTSAAGAQPALEQQIQSADSAARASRRPAGTRGRRARSDSESARGRGALGAAGRRDSSHTRRREVPLDRVEYLSGKLDLDIATAAQIDSLPGVLPSVAKRIVADRLRRGPFLNAAGLRRVPGVGPALLAKIDSLITFSGRFQPGVPGDTIIPRPRRRTRSRPPAPP